MSLHRYFLIVDAEALRFLERRFTEHYESLQDVGEVREALPQLTGQTPRVSGPAPLKGLLPTLSTGTGKAP